MKKWLFPLIITLTIGCSESSMVGHKRDESFYNNLSNPTTDINTAETKISQLKVLETNDKYNMRLAMFDDHQFYYQIDRLGNGTGTWKFRDGAVELHAKRPIFDINITLSATQAEGDAMMVRFVDRFGLNTLNTQMREPAAQEKLRDFTKADKDI